MPEGPELHMTSLFINKTCEGLVFSGKVVKNPIHKGPDIDWNVPLYTIKAESRGKEIILQLKECRPTESENVNEKNNLTSCFEPKALQPDAASAELSILFTFGMSGKFDFTPVNECPKHSHLSFVTQKDPKMALSFIDQRRFGKWCANKSWSSERGPCVINEYDEFVVNLANNLDDTVFKKPICEVMLNQKYFNGIGNYLRAEILYRCKIPPFEKANTVLKLNNSQAQTDQTVVGEKNGKKASKISKTAAQESILLHEDELLQSNSSINRFEPKSQELVRLCHTVPLEVVKLGTTKYTLANLYSEDDIEGGSGFTDWLQCYYKPGMKNMADHNKRTIWFSGPTGSLVPKDQKPRVRIQSEKSKKGQKPIKTKEEIDESKRGKNDSHSKIDDPLPEANKRKRKKIYTNMSSDKIDTTPSINSGSLTEETPAKLRKRAQVNKANKNNIVNDSHLKIETRRSARKRKE